MSEQLWYTWSTNGFGIAKGNRVRAASQNLTDVEGQRVSSFIKLAIYTLPNEIDPFLDPDEAPLCLSFFKVGPQQETILLQRKYIGLDGVRRPGAFFSHLLTDLPSVPSLSPSGSLPFTAREAISLWTSPTLWCENEEELQPNQRNLPPIPDEKLTSGAYNGPLKEQFVTMVAPLFKQFLQTFLSLLLSGEKKRFYLVGSPSTVATLIWGLTHSLPRTLTAMAELTFSTFEANVESDPKPWIVGTYRDRQHFKKDCEHASDDLPAEYYQENNVFGLTINCETSQKYTPFHPGTISERNAQLISRYTNFVLESFAHASLNTRRLSIFLDKAEQRNITTPESLLNYYVAFNEMLSKAELFRLLDEQARTIQALFSISIPTPRQHRNIQTEIEFLQQENIQQSILNFMIQDPSWWHQRGQPLLNLMYEQTKLAPRRESLLQDQQAIRHALFPLAKIIVEQLVQAISQDQVDAMVTWHNGLRFYLSPPSPWIDLWRQLLSRLTGTCYTPTYELWWDSYKGKQAMKQLRANINPDTLAALTEFALASARELGTALTSGSSAILFWADVLTTTSSLKEAPQVGTCLLNNLVHVSCTPHYEQWYQKYGQENISSIIRLADTSRDTSLKQSLVAFTMYTVSALSKAIINNDSETALFWHILLLQLAPVQEKPQYWLQLFAELREIPTWDAFYHWWTTQGKKIALTLRLLVEREHSIEQDHLLLFSNTVVRTLTQSILDGDTQSQETNIQTISYLLGILTAIVPAHDTIIWPTLLQELNRSTRTFTMRWDLHTILLTSWQHAPSLTIPEALPLLSPWLEISWLNLNQFFSLNLPMNWRKIAITNALKTAQTTPVAQILKVVQTHAPLFEEVLQELMKNAGTQNNVLQFFKLLAQHNYPRTPHLLGQLFKACSYHQQTMDALLQAMPSLIAEAHSTQLNQFLEQDCCTLFASYNIPPTLLRWLDYYVNHLTIEQLDTAPTRGLFQLLAERQNSPALRLPSTLEQAVAHWIDIIDFLASPRINAATLYALRESIGIINQSHPEMRQRLFLKLVPHLVQLVTTEADLTRVIDSIGKGHELALLQNMTKVAGKIYAQENPPSHLAIYARVIVTETSQMSHPGKQESFLPKCLYLLFKNADPEVYNRYIPEPLWPNFLLNTWEKCGRHLVTFLQCLNQSSIPGITKHFQASYEPFLDQRDKLVVHLAHQFSNAHTIHDDLSMLQAHEQLVALCQPQAPLYSEEQEGRLIHVRQRNKRSLNSGSLPVMHLNPNTAVVAKIAHKVITLETLNSTQDIKKAYISLKMTELQRKMQTLIGKDYKKEQKELKQKIAEMKKLLDDIRKLRQSTLDELIDDVFIRLYIEGSRAQPISAPEQANRWKEFDHDLDAQVEKAYQELSQQRYEGNATPFNRNNSRTIKEALQVFIKRDLIRDLLTEDNRGTLEQCTQWYRTQYKSEVQQINYGLAALPPPRYRL